MKKILIVALSAFAAVSLFAEETESNESGSKPVALHYSVDGSKLPDGEGKPSFEIAERFLKEAQLDGWTEESLQLGLKRLDKWYQANQHDSKFRAQLNGEPVSIVIDKDANTKTYTYPNGTTYVEKFNPNKRVDIEKKLSAEERMIEHKKKKEQLRLGRLRSKEARLLLLKSEEGFRKAMERSMEDKKYPEDLARALLQHEINQLTEELISEGWVITEVE